MTSQNVERTKTQAVRLIEPHIEYQESYLEALAEYHAEGRYFDRDAKRLAADFAGFVQNLRERADPAKTRAGWVPDTVLWLVDGERYIGRASIRHELNEHLRIVGGHIGYDVRPSARRRGYGTRLLALALERAAALGLRDVLVTCDSTNDASRRIIERNGGRLTDEIEVPGQSVSVLRFWIATATASERGGAAMDNAQQRPVALITGGSRGIGAATAVELAGRGYDVIIIYRNKAARATEVVAAIEERGGRALAVGGDVTRDEDVRRLFAEVETWGRRLDLLVLNASGGLERDLVAADPNYPFKINRDAQIALVEAARPHLGRDGTIVFVTSHWAHRYGAVEQLPSYEPVAASKHAGEQALRARQAELAEAGIRLIVVTGDLIDGTITAKLLERAAPGLAESRRGERGALTTRVDMAAAIANAATDPTLPTGHTVVVGGGLGSLPGLASPGEG